MKKKTLGKKGSIADIFVFLILTFIIGILFVLFTFIGDTTMVELLENAPSMQASVGNNTNMTEIINDSFGPVPRAYANLRWIGVMLIIGMALSIFIFSYLVTVKPVFFVAYVLMVVCAVIVSVPISNTYEELSENPTLESSFEGFGQQTWIFSHLPTWTSIIGIIGGTLLCINIVRRDQYG